MWLGLLLGIGVFFISLLFAKQCINPNSRLYILDHPNKRSLHENSIPKTGGVAIVLSILLGWILLFFLVGFESKQLVLSAALIILCTLGVADNFRELTPYFRLIIHSITAGIVVYSGYQFESIGTIELASNYSNLILIFASVFFIIWITNIYNFMDGMDGFAASMTVFGFATLGMLGFIDGHKIYAISSLIVCFSSLGFLVWNFPPAKLFMGDSGSVTLGFLAAVFSLWAIQLGFVDFWLVLVIFAPFIADSSFTLLKRIIKKEKIWEAHNTHLYQKLVMSGMGHKKVLILHLSLMLLSSSGAIFLALNDYNNLYGFACVYIVLYVILFTVIKIRLFRD